MNNSDYTPSKNDIKPGDLVVVINDITQPLNNFITFTTGIEVLNGHEERSFRIINPSKPIRTEIGTIPTPSKLCIPAKYLLKIDPKDLDTNAVREELQNGFDLLGEKKRFKDSFESLIKQLYK